MSEFVWHDHYLIGNQKVDLQHQQLFNLANNLVQSKNQGDLAENAMLMYQHVREHFRVEEAFMKDCGYPHSQQHIETHNLMLDKLVEVGDKINRLEWQQHDVLKFMQEWIAHILEEDAAINAYCAKLP